MEIKPSDALLAVMQFLEILVPGSLLAFTLKEFAILHVLGSGRPLPAISSDGEGWVLFFVASYLIGHFVFLLASFIDDWLYDPMRRKLKPVTVDQAYLRATNIRKNHLGESAEVMNTFKWAKAELHLRFPGALAELHRYESESKFFRSLVVVLLFLALRGFFYWRLLEVISLLSLAMLSFWRYFDQRWKSTELAYQFLIAIDDLDRTVSKTTDTEASA